MTRSHFICVHRTQLVNIFLSIALLLTLFSGCASFGERHLKIRSDFEDGKWVEANNEIDRRLKKSKRGEADLLKLNKALIDLSGGNAKEAEKLLREVRDRFDEIERENLAKAGQKSLALLTDDNAVAYAGEDYEKVLIRVFLALANLIHDGTDAPAYALQIGKKQNEIIKNAAVKDPKDETKTRNPKAENYRQVAIGPYIVGALREETRRDYDDAVRAYETVCAWEPNFMQAKRDLARAKTGVPCAPGNGVLYVFGLVGSGPYKLQQNCEAGQEAQLWASIFLNMASSRAIPLGIAPVLIPVVVKPQSLVPSLGVSVDGNFVSTTETILDIGRMAEEQFEAVKPQIIARAMIRRALKKGMTYGAQEALDTNEWLGLLLAAGGMVWEAIETADTRCWNLLPAEIQVTRIELPAGTHTLSLAVAVGMAYETTIRVDAGRNTYVLANFPGQKMIGEIVVSNRPAP